MSDQHDTVVVKEGGSSTGVIVGIIASILVLGAGWYFLLGPGAGSTSHDRHQRQRRAPERRSGRVLTRSLLPARWLLPSGRGLVSDAPSVTMSPTQEVA